MANFYMSPPTAEHLAYLWAERFASEHSVKVTVTIDRTEATCTQSIDRRPCAMSAWPFGAAHDAPIAKEKP